jgi:hypothetical protein
MESMANGGGGYLRKRGAQRAGRVRDPARLDLQRRIAGAEHMAEFMNYRALLCRHQQEQKAECF